MVRIVEKQDGGATGLVILLDQLARDGALFGVQRMAHEAAIIDGFADVSIARQEPGLDHLIAHDRAIMAQGLQWRVGIVARAG